MCFDKRQHTRTLSFRYSEGEKNSKFQHYLNIIYQSVDMKEKQNKEPTNLCHISDSESVIMMTI